MREVNIVEWKKTGEGFEADTYFRDDDDTVMLKLYKPYILKDRIIVSYETTKRYINMGISTPKVYEVVSCDGRIGIIYERIKDKISLYRMFVNNHEKAEEIGEMFGKALKDFHTHTCDPDKHSSRIQVLNNIILGMVRESDFLNKEQKEEMQEKVIKFFKKYSFAEKDNNLLMGDTHAGNVILAHDKLYFIDLSIVQYGDPMLDVGWVYSGIHNAQVDIAVPKEEVVPQEYKERYFESFKKSYFAGVAESDIEKKLDEAKKYYDIMDLCMRMYITRTYDALAEILDK